MDIISLFPTPVGVFNLNRKLTFEEEHFIFNLSKRPNVENQVSVDSYVLNSEVLKDLKLFFEKSLDEYLKLIYNPSTDCSLSITQSWCNYTEYQQGHHAHTHGNSIVSGVFYIKTCNSDNITFVKDAKNLHPIHVDVKEFNIFNSVSWWLPAVQNTLFLFPSTLNHMVPTTDSKELRISMSFNTFFSGTIGHRKSLTELILP